MTPKKRRSKKSRRRSKKHRDSGNSKIELKQELLISRLKKIIKNVNSIEKKIKKYEKKSPKNNKKYQERNMLINNYLKSPGKSKIKFDVSMLTPNYNAVSTFKYNYLDDFNRNSNINQQGEYEIEEQQQFMGEVGGGGGGEYAVGNITESPGGKNIRTSTKKGSLQQNARENIKNDNVNISMTSTQYRIVDLNNRGLNKVNELNVTESKRKRNENLENLSSESLDVSSSKDVDYNSGETVSEYATRSSDEPSYSDTTISSSNRDSDILLSPSTPSIKSNNKSFSVVTPSPIIYSDTPSINQKRSVSFTNET